MEHQSEGGRDCIGTMRDDGIYVWNIVRATRQSIYEGSDFYVDCRTKHPTDQRFMMIFDLRPDGFPPLTFTFNHFKSLFSKYPMPEGARAAYLMRDNSPLISVAKGLFDVLRLGTNRRFYYGPDAEAQAVAFLKEGLVVDTSVLNSVD